ncbi:MAG TPA: Holliday junction branch migration protein RuvA, partial [Candidatus Methylomirabilis sp.]|nr:Holliday junction branch migration protein RuvA [Candidatus Methylomirabilis sp.]
KGKIIKKGSNFIILVVHESVGYKIFVNETMAAEAKPGEEMELFTHQYIREDAEDLYGFTTYEKLAMFEMLLSVSGIGPKSGLGIMAIAGVEEIKTAIAEGDIHLLTKVSGIGKRTAERVILDLRDKVGFLESSKTDLGAASATGSSRGDEIDALVALGYSLQQAREALSKVDKSITDSGKRIREALKNIK